MALDIWFVNVGHGDSTIIKFPTSDRAMMIDINNSSTLDEETQNELMAFLGVSTLDVLLGRSGAATSPFKDYEKLLEDPIDVYKREIGAYHRMWRFVLTHPDMDHMSGMYRLMQQEPDIKPSFFWDTDNAKQVADSEWEKSLYDRRDWDEYQRVRKSSDANDPTKLNLYRDQQGEYWTDDSIRIFAPTPEMVDEGNKMNNQSGWNHMSYVLKITHGKAAVILPGDTSITAQQNMVEVFGNDLQAGLLKAPHHGRKSGFCEDFVKAVAPDYTVVSVGKKPDTDASSSYRKHTKKRTLSTRFNGTIHAKLWEDGDIYLYDHSGKRLDDEGIDATALSRLLGS